MNLPFAKLPKGLFNLIYIRKTALTGCANKMAQLQQLIYAVPSMNFLNGIRTSYKKELCPLAILGYKLGYGINGIGWSRTVHLYVRYLKIRVGASRQHRHYISVLGHGNTLLLLMRWHSSRYKDNLIQIILIANCLSSHEMPHMNRIKGTSHDAQTLLFTHNTLLQ